MNFKEWLLRAKAGEQDAKEYIFEMYRPLLLKNSIVDKEFDEDLFQELSCVLLICIQNFRIEL